MNRLLHRTLLNFIVYSSLIVIVSIPLFYFVIKKMFHDEMDEFFMLRKSELERNKEYLKTDEAIRLYGILDTDIVLTPSKEIAQIDSFYSIDYYDSLSGEMNPYREYLTGIEINNKPYKLIIRESLVGNDELIKGILTVQGIFLAFLLIGLIVINQRQSRKLWKPFYNTLDKLQHYQLDKGEPLNLAETNIIEFDDLNKEINQLIKKNYQIYLNQKEFTQNASHELQTPLAIFQSKVELLMQTQPLSEEQAGIIQNIASATGRLSRLNRNLLLLSKIENNQFLQKEPIDLKEEAESVIMQFEENINKKKVTFQIEIKSPVALLANRILIEILIRNLVSNAIRYSCPEGEINILIRENTLIIENTGAAPLEEPEKIFDRFYRSHSESEGSGLGLAIVKNICDTSGWEITYSPKDNIHSFLVRF